MYSPTLGRWATMDPVGYTAGDHNLYRTVGNSPISSTDSTGLKKDPPFPSEAGTMSDAIENVKLNPIEFFAVGAFGVTRTGRTGYMARYPVKHPYGRPYILWEPITVGT